MSRRLHLDHDLETAEDDLFRVSPESQSEVRQFRVAAAQTGQRLDRVLVDLTAATRSQIKILINAARVRVAGEVKKAGYLMRAGELIEVLPLPVAPTVPVPQEIPLDILYEDEYLAVINKPPGMVVHPAPGQWQGTVVNALLFRWGWAESVDSFRPGIVHRLDKDTSGVLLVAKDQRILERLAHAFKERRVQKTYVAVVVGRFSSPGGEIALPIGRHPVERKKMWVNARQGRAAVSRYQVIAEAQGLTLVRMFPETGRTHQLRVHLAAVGHPIVGDKMYGASHIGSRRLPVVARAFSRQALHAVALAFSHPVSGEPVQFQAPYPADFLELVKIFVAENKSAKEGLLPVDDKKKIGYVRT